jgi:hypothetical protein
MIDALNHLILRLKAVPKNALLRLPTGQAFISTELPIGELCDQAASALDLMQGHHNRHHSEQPTIDADALDRALKIFLTAMQQSKDDIRFSLFQAIAAMGVTGHSTFSGKTEGHATREGASPVTPTNETVRHMNSCENCAHMHIITVVAYGDWLERERYVCRRYPPVAGANRSRYPEIELEDYCGEFKPTDSKGGETK